MCAISSANSLPYWSPLVPSGCLCFPLLLSGCLWLWLIVTELWLHTSLASSVCIQITIITAEPILIVVTGHRSPTDLSSSNNRAKLNGGKRHCGNTGLEGPPGSRGNLLGGSHSHGYVYHCRWATAWANRRLIGPHRLHCKPEHQSLGPSHFFHWLPLKHEWVRRISCPPLLCLKCVKIGCQTWIKRRFSLSARGNSICEMLMTY